MMRARLLASLCRDGNRSIVYCRVLAPGTGKAKQRRAQRELAALVSDEVSGAAEARLLESHDTVDQLVQLTAEADLVVLGVQRRGRQRRAFGDFTRRLVEATRCPLLLISQR